MDRIDPMQEVSEKTLPVQFRWVFQNAVETLWGGILLIAFFTWIAWIGGSHGVSVLLIVIGIAGFLVLVVVGAYSRNGLRFSVDKEGFRVSVAADWQKAQSISYKQIKNVSLKRNLFDMLFGLNTVLVEIDHSMGRPPIRHSMIGILGDTIVIPGLTKKDAEVLKAKLSNR